MNKLFFVILIVLVSPVFGEETKTFRFTGRVYDVQDLSNQASAFENINIVSRLSQTLQEMGFVHEPDEITYLIIDYEIRGRTGSMLPGSIQSAPEVAMIRAYRDGADPQANVGYADLIYFEINLPAAAMSSRLRSELIDEGIQLFGQQLLQVLESDLNKQQLSLR